MPATQSFFLSPFVFPHVLMLARESTHDFLSPFLILVNLPSQLQRQSAKQWKGERRAQRRGLEAPEKQILQF